MYLGQINFQCFSNMFAITKEYIIYWANNLLVQTGTNYPLTGKSLLTGP